VNKFVLTFASTAAVALGSFAAADDLANATFLANAFVGNCAQNAGRNDRVSAFADFMEYEELEGDLKTMLSPQDPSVEYDGWIVREDDAPLYLLGISEYQNAGVTLQTCSIANPSVSMDFVTAEIERLMIFDRQIDSFDLAGQRNRVWSTTSLAEGSFVTIMDAPDMGEIGGTVSLSARKEN
jgi:hypothetical protein